MHAEPHSASEMALSTLGTRDKKGRVRSGFSLQGCYRAVLLSSGGWPSCYSQPLWCYYFFYDLCSCSHWSAAVKQLQRQVVGRSIITRSHPPAGGSYGEPCINLSLIMLLHSLLATSMYFLYGWGSSIFLLWTVVLSALQFSAQTVESTAFLADCPLLLCNILKREMFILIFTANRFDLFKKCFFFSKKHTQGSLIEMGLYRIKWVDRGLYG